MNCPSCNTRNLPNAKFCANCGAPLSIAQQTPYQAPSSNQMHGNMAAAFVYAGFWKRLFAYIIDHIIIYIVMLVVTVWGFGTSVDFADPEAIIGGMGIYFLAYYIFWWMYFAIQEGSSKQATLGKRALGIKVCDMNGFGLSFPHAAGRQLAGAITSMTFSIGYLLAAFTGKKQALHDMIAGCVVVNKNFDARQIQATNMAPPPGMSVGAIIGVVLLVLIIPVGGIIAAVSIPAYQDYTIRAQVSEAYHHAKSATHDVINYAEDSGYWPQNFEQIGLNTDDFHRENYHVRIGEEGSIIVRFNRPQVISTGMLQLTPELTTDSGYIWQCQGIGLDPEYLPANCK